MAKTIIPEEQANQLWKNQNGFDYRIGTLEYPDGLRKYPDLQNYVAFYINTRDKATGGKSKNSSHYVSAATQAKEDALNNPAAKLNQNDINKTAKYLGENAGAIVGLTIGLGGVLMGVKVKNLPALATTAGLGYAVVEGVSIPETPLTPEMTLPGLKDLIKNKNLSLFQSGSTSRLKDVVTLHISEKPVVSYGVNYTNRDIGALAGVLIQGSAKESVFKAIGSDGEFQSRLLAEVARIPQLKSAGGTLSDIIELNSRQKTNPFREVLFESVDYRTFQFSYRFLPKTSSETEKVKDIIETFKKHMHPEITSSKLFYIYPSEFDIKYFHKNKENEYLHKFARCALTDMVVDYGGDQFVTFSNGAPVEIGMTLKFQELEQMTSERIQNGY
jgi:hypothetical protein